MSDATQRNRLAVALDLASQGIPVFPFVLIGDDKKPVIKDWANAATTDPEQIEAWFGNGSDYRIGVPTGKRSGRDVLDADPRHGGDKWIADHIDKLPTTRTHATKRGGCHRFLQHRDGMRGSQSKIGQGIDILADDNFVAWWPGEGLAVENADTIAEWPEWLAELAMAGRANGSGGDVELDKRLPPSAQAVIDLLNRMPNKLETNRGAYTTVMLSAAGCIDALAEAGTPATPEEAVAIGDAAIDWAERWPGHDTDSADKERQKWLDDWSTRANRLAGWQSLQHVAAELIDGYADEVAAEEFSQAGPIPPPKSKPKPDLLEIWDAGDDDYVIEPRGWLLGNTFCRRFLSSLLADGGVGKTALRIAQLAGMATGRSLTGEHLFQRCRVLIVSLEDDRDELRRRVYAVMRHHGIRPEDVKGWLFLAAPKGLKLARMIEGSPHVAELDALIRKAVTAHDLDLVSLDPFVKSHGVGESDNTAIDYVCTLLVKIAIDLNIAADTPHHTRKGLHEAGDASAGRGASSMVDAGRLVYTATPMTSGEAEQFALAEDDRRSLFRVDSGKVNIAPPSREAKWFLLIGVKLGNATEQYPNGDEVQTVIPWFPPDIWAGMDDVAMVAIMAALDAGFPDGRRYSNHHSAGERGAWHVVMKHMPNLTKGQARQVVDAWIKNGALIEQDYDDPVARKPRKGLFRNPNRTTNN